MSIRNTRPQPRRVRRQRPTSGSAAAPVTRADMPPLLRWLTNPKLFLVIGLLFAGAILLSGVGGILFSGSSSGGTQQANEAADVARDETGATATPGGAEATATPQIKRYSAAPAMSIDPAKKYTATIETTQGNILVELDASAAPEAVNSFVFLAREHYYDGTLWMQVTTNPDGSKFTAQAGDPTQTGLGTPGYTIPENPTANPFARGAVGLASGQFYISYGDYPALNGKYTIVGRVIAGLDVLDRLKLLNVKQRNDGADQVKSVVITES